MEAIYSFETSVGSQRTTRLYIPEDRTLYEYRCEILKSYVPVSNFTKFFLHRVKLSPLCTAATVRPTVPATDYDDDCGAIGGMKFGRGKRSTRRQPAPVPLCPPQIPHDLSRTRTRTAAVGSRRLTS
jgi:hypothetical protein